MGNRFSRVEREKRYRRLVDRDGDVCRDCHMTPEPQAMELTLDHIDGDRTNHAMDNLQLLCKSCNTAKKNRLQAQQAAEWRRYLELTQQASPPAVSQSNGHAPPPAGAHQVYDSISEGREIERVRVRENNRQRRQEIGDYGASPEFRANRRYENSWLDWMDERLDRNGFIPTTEAINAGAAKVDCQPQTTERYVKKWTSSEGHLDQERDEQGRSIIVRRTGCADNQ